MFVETGVQVVMSGELLRHIRRVGLALQHQLQPPAPDAQATESVEPPGANVNSVSDSGGKL